MANESRNVQIGFGVDATSAKEGFAGIRKSAEETAQALAQAGSTASRGVDGIGEKAQASAQKLDKATSSIIGSVQRATAAFQAGEKGSAKYFEALAQQRGANVDALRPYLQQLDAARIKQEEARRGLGTMGVSAAQTAAALRGVPAQFTDIVTALQGGQQPLTVLLQQGGQLKDMFGGAGAAAKALGGYVLGLVNPLTITLGLAGGLAYAFSQGREEAEALVRALQGNGLRTGTTVSQINELAKALSSEGFTRGAAAQALGAIASTGAVASDSLKKYAATALEVERLGGQSFDKTAQAFKQLADEPTKASLKFNEALNYLSSAQFQQIKLLEDQGRKTDAARIAQDLYDEAINGSVTLTRANLGYLQNSWNAVSGAAKSAWDAMSGLGRRETSDERIAKLRQQLAVLDGPLNNAARANPTSPLGRQRAQIADALTLLERLNQAVQDNAKFEAEHQKREQARIAWAQEGEKYLTSQAKLELELQRIRNQGAAAGASEAEIARRQALARENASKGKDNKEATEAQRALEKYRNLVGDLNNESSGLSAGFNEQVKQLQAGWRLSGDAVEVYDRAYGLLLAKQPFAIKAQKELAEAEKQYQEERKKRFQEIEKQYEQEVNAAERSAQSVVDRVESMKDEASALERSRLLNISVAQALEDVRIARLEDVRAQAAQAGNQEVVDAINKEIAARKELTGLIARKEYEKAAEDGAKKAADEWQRTSDKIETSITDALMRGFESGKGFIENLRDTAVNMFNTLVLRPVIQATVSPIAGALTGNYSSAAGGSSLLNAASGAQSLYGLATGGATSSLANLIGGAGSLFGSQALSSFATGMKGASLASGLAGPTTAGAGGLTGLGASFATAVPYVAAAALAYQVLNSLGAFKGASYHTGSAIGINADGSSTGRLANQSTFRDQRVWGGFTEVDRSGGAIYADPLTQVGQSIVGAINSTLTTFGRAAGVSAFAAFGADGSDDSEGVLRIYGSNGEVLAANSRRKYSSNAQQGFQEYMSEAGKVARDALIASDIPGWAKDILNSLGASPDLTAVTQSIATINQTQSTLQTISKTMAQFAGLTDDATGSLLTLFGGIDKITESTQSFVQNYYTDQEKIDLSTRNMKAALDAVNLALPTTKAGFRALAESLDLNTESGRKAYVTLMGISTEFASTTDAVAKLADEVTASIKEMTSGIEQEIARIKGLSASGTTKSVAQLQADFAINTAQARAGDQAAIDLLPSISQALLEAAEATAGSSLDVAIIQAQTLASLQATLDAISDPTKRLKGYASGGDFGGGWRIVGERGSELEATGPARIFSADQTARILSAGQQDSQAAAEVRELRRELAALRDDQRVQTAVLAANTGRTARILEAVTPDGTSLATTAA